MKTRFLYFANYFVFVFKETDSIKQKSYLFSNWLQKDVDDYKLRFNITSETFELFKLQVFVFDEQMKSTLLKEITESDADVSHFCL
jgi:hypothetical protein